jgi:hypothetical protein
MESLFVSHRKVVGEPDEVLVNVTTKGDEQLVSEEVVKFARTPATACIVSLSVPLTAHPHELRM